MNIITVQGLFNINSSPNKANFTNHINTIKHNTLDKDSFHLKSFDTLSFGNRYKYDYGATIDLKNAKTGADVRWALSRGANPNGIDGNGVPVLHSVVRNKTTGALKELIKNGANVDATDKDGETALIIATRCKNLDAVLTLIDAKANLDAKDKLGNSALTHAIEWAAKGQPFIQKVLVSAGAGKSDYRIEYEPDETGELKMVLTPKEFPAIYDLLD